MKTNATFRIHITDFYTYPFLLICLLLNFNAVGQSIKTNLIETWDGTDWVYAFMETDNYDDNNRLTLANNQRWEPITGTWENLSRTTYTNNANGTIQQAVVESWDNLSNQYVQVSRNIYTYTAANKVKIIIGDLWFRSLWQASSRTTYTYDASDYLTKTLNEAWDFPSGSFKNASQTDYYNNANGTINYDITQTANSTTGAWENSEKNTYTYVNSTKPKTELIEKWISGSWVKYTLVTNDYKGGYLTKSVEQIWDASTDEWINESQSLFTNNTDGTIHMIVMQSWELPTSNWVNVTRFTFDMLLGVGDFTDPKEAMVFPNPARDLVTIKTAVPDMEYHIIDQLGRQILIGTLDKEETIVDISQLSTGLYFIRLGNQNAQSLKMIKN